MVTGLLHQDVAFETKHPFRKGIPTIWDGSFPLLRTRQEQTRDGLHSAAKVRAEVAVIFICGCDLPATILPAAQDPDGEAKGLQRL